MKASEAQLLAFIQQSPQFIIPIYQRTYSWTTRECQQMWDDILRSGRDESVSGHFIGSVVYIEQGLSQSSNRSPLLVIDGQQRLTTATLLIEALARHLGDEEPFDGFSDLKLRHYYLLNPLEKGDKHYKLLLTQTDRESVIALVTQNPWPHNPSFRIKENFDFFMQRVKALGDDLDSLCRGLSKLLIVDIALDRNYDNPQLIFESMNSTGRELSQADLIRNFILMGLEPEHQTALYSGNWRPIEVAFGQEAYGMHFDSFMRHYLTLKTGDIPNVNAVYEAFKAHARSPKVEQAGVDALVAEIHKFAEYYCAMALGRENDKHLASAFQDLRELRVDVAYPFLLELYDDHSNGILPSGDFLEAVRLVEAYVFRRAVCSIPTNSLNKTFATFGRALKKDRYLESIKAHLLTLPSYRRFPDDEEFMEQLQIRDLYNFPRRSYLLRRLENEGRKEKVSIDEYTIEHIMPQNERLSAEWRLALGPDWGQIHLTWLHRLGNLTLTGYNSEYSDRPFLEKRDMEGGLRESPLKLNQGLGTMDTWDVDTIRQRGEKLAALASKVWEAPTLPADVLAAYRPTTIQSIGYSLADHPQLADGTPMRAIFDMLRREVLALDPGITEEVLKLYIAYKAETNFVDVVPQSQRLRLALNMPFNEISDPRGMCKDVTNVGRWGNGDVEVGLSSLDDVPYVIGLIRQSLERQLGNEAVA
jgi:uncharacterized protein with ParB-like and HNH nuclease domain/predicted transport protein